MRKFLALPTAVQNQITEACENSVFPKQGGLTTPNDLISLNIHGLDTEQRNLTPNSHSHADIFYVNTGKNLPRGIGQNSLQLKATLACGIY